MLRRGLVCTAKPAPQNLSGAAGAALDPLSRVIFRLGYSWEHASGENIFTF
jgi:hypothetical protein